MIYAFVFLVASFIRINKKKIHARVTPKVCFLVKLTISITNPPGTEQPVLQVSPASPTTEAAKKDDDEVQYIVYSV